MEGTFCRDKCSYGYFARYTDSKCIACDSAAAFCLECANTASTCISCIETYYLEGTTCTQNCANGTYEDTDTKRCEFCSP